MDFQHILYLGALLLFAFGCRTFDNRFLQKIGWLGLLGASYDVGYFLSGGSHVAGVAGVLAWFILPWLEILGRVRKLRFPLRNEIKHRFPPSREIFPDLNQLSQELTNAGFEEVSDTGWKWHEIDHFMRLFYHPQTRTQAAISLAQQGQFAFSHVSLTSRTPNEWTFTTSNYPFPPTMQFPPLHMLERHPYAESLEDLMAAHDALLERFHMRNEDLSEMEPEQLTTRIEEEMVAQIDHNMHAGIITPTGDGEFRYSWRGYFYLWFQVVKDMIRV